jgi:hypothetical protein
VDLLEPTTHGSAQARESSLSTLRHSLKSGDLIGGRLDLLLGLPTLRPDDDGQCGVHVTSPPSPAPSARARRRWLATVAPGFLSFLVTFDLHFDGMDYVEVIQ